MTETAFSGARLKVERANHHINDLDATFQTFVQTHPHVLRQQEDSEAGRQYIEIHKPIALPLSISLMAGDAFHNLRTALDHTMWEFVGRISGKDPNPRTMFPKGDSFESYKGLCESVKELTPEAVNFLVGIGAYRDGPGHALYQLNVLDNIDKHRMILTALNGTEVGGIRGYAPDGRLVLDLGRGMFTSSANFSTRLVAAPANLKFEFDKDAKATPFVIFGKDEPFPLKPIIPTFRELRDQVIGVVEAFAAFCDEHSGCS